MDRVGHVNKGPSISDTFSGAPDLTRETVVLTNLERVQ